MCMHMPYDVYALNQDGFAGIIRELKFLRTDWPCHSRCCKLHVGGVCLHCKIFFVMLFSEINFSL